MSVGNLCFFAVLATIVAFPAVRELDVGARQSNTRTADLPKFEMPTAVLLPLPSRNPRDLGPGKLLVASRELADPNFAETVILLVHCDTEGVVGLMLNRRTDLQLSRVFAQSEAARDRSDRVYLGGPVETPTVFALLRSTDKLEGAEHVFGRVYWLSTKTSLEKAISSHPDPGAFHVYLGYAGWTTNQLSNEVRLGGWFIFQADDQTVFEANPDALWRQMIEKTELRMAECPTKSPQPPAGHCRDRRHTTDVENAAFADRQPQR